MTIINAQMLQTTLGQRQAATQAWQAAVDSINAAPLASEHDKNCFQDALIEARRMEQEAEKALHDFDNMFKRWWPASN